MPPKVYRRLYDFLDRALPRDGAVAVGRAGAASGSMSKGSGVGGVGAVVPAKRKVKTVLASDAVSKRRGKGSGKERKVVDEAGDEDEEHGVLEGDAGNEEESEDSEQDDLEDQEDEDEGENDGYGLLENGRRGLSPWLTDAKRRDYAKWKKGIMKRVAAIERQTA